jgi:hypothetical protein
MVFTVNHPYTIVFIHALTGVTMMAEITIIGIDTKLGRCLYRLRNSEQQGTLPANFDQVMVFNGHDLGFTVGRYGKPGFFDFASDDPIKLEEFILANCLNLKEQNHYRIWISDLRVQPPCDAQNLPIQITNRQSQDQSILINFRATLEHDKGLAHLRVVSSSGEQGAISQIVAIENCPRCAIVALKPLSITYHPFSTQNLNNIFFHPQNSDDDHNK